MTRWRTLAALATVLPSAALVTVLPAHAGLRTGHAGLPAGQSGTPLVVVERAWAASASAVLGLPAAAGGAAAERRAHRITDRALLAALREATVGAPARVTLERDGSGRYFVATTAPDAVEEVLHTMRRVAASPIPSRHLAEAVDAVAWEDAFRVGSPRSRFDSAFASLSSGSGRVGGRPAPGNRDSAWVVVGPGLLSPPGPADALAWGEGLPAPSGVALVGSRRHFVPGEPTRIELPADVVTTWVGSAYRFASATTLLEAHFLRLVLEGWMESLRDPSLYEFATEIDSSGQLLVRFSASREDASAWEARLDRAVAAVAEGGNAGPAGDELAAEGPAVDEPAAEGPAVDEPAVDGSNAQRVAALMRRAQGVWSRRMADPAACARAVAEALLRGASAEQAKAFVATPPIAPSQGSVAEAARGLRLTARVSYGT